MWNLFVSKLSSSPDAIVGVSLIGIYFAWIIGAALYRIKRGEHLHH